MYEYLSGVCGLWLHFCAVCYFRALLIKAKLLFSRFLWCKYFIDLLDYDWEKQKQKKCQIRLWHFHNRIQRTSYNFVDINSADQHSRVTHYYFKQSLTLETKIHSSIGEWNTIKQCVKAVKKTPSHTHTHKKNTSARKGGAEHKDWFTITGRKRREET